MPTLTRIQLATDHLRAARSSFEQAARLMSADGAPEALVKLCTDAHQHTTDIIVAACDESIRRDTAKHSVWRR